MLQVKEITTEYSGMRALDRVSVTLGENEFISVIGPNGAGKSTLLKTISGTVKCTSGEIYFMDTNITHMKAHKRTGLGIIHIPEGRRVFPSLTVIENLELGAYRPEARDSVAENLKIVSGLFPILKERHNQLAGTLSGGEQQMLAIGRGLMTLPQILMLDEPSLGLAPLIVMHLFEVIKRINQEGTTIMLVEQNMHLALSTVQRGYVIENGRIILEGESNRLLKEDHMRKAYLGI